MLRKKTSNFKSVLLLFRLQFQTTETTIETTTEKLEKEYNLKKLAEKVCKEAKFL